MILNDVNEGIEKRKKRKRVGRGPGSGHGKTSGRGDKGHSSRSGFSYPFSFEGGQMPLRRRVAKRGFNNKFHAVQLAIINVASLEDKFAAGAVVDVESLTAAGFLKKAYDEIKILGNGHLTKKLTVKAHRFSQSAVDKIAAAGGSTEVIA
jgi:large subunit ribosomal protein L15